MIIVLVLATFVIAALSGMGVGGGGLFLIWLSWTTTLPQLTAQGMNLLFFLFSAGSSLLVHVRSRHLYAGAIAIAVAFGLPGAFLGSYLSLRVDESLLRKGFGVILVIGGLLSLRAGKREDAAAERPKGKKGKKLP